MHSAFSIFLIWEVFYLFIFLLTSFLSFFLLFIQTVSHTSVLLIKSYYDKYCDSTKLHITETSRAWANGLLIGSTLVCKGAVRPSEVSGKEAGNWFAYRFWFQQVPWGYRGPRATCPSATEGPLLSRYIRGSRKSKGQKWGDLWAPGARNSLEEITLSGQALPGWLIALSVLTSMVCSFILTLTIWCVDTEPS